MSENLARQFLLREDVVFLNHGSFGACPRPVFETYQRWQRELEAQPVEFLGRELTETMRVPRIALAAELGTTQENIVGLTNATLGLNIVAQSLDLKPGDQILTTDHEYSALEKTWAYVARRTGAEIVVVRKRSVPPACLEARQGSGDRDLGVAGQRGAIKADVPACQGATPSAGVRVRSALASAS